MADKKYVSGDISAQDIGAMVAEARSWVKLSQEGLAEHIGVSETLVKNVENGKTSHGLSVLRKTCAAFDLKTSLRVEQK